MPTAPLRSLAVVTPVLDDWECLERLLADLGEQADRLPPTTVFVVDDGSLTRPDPAVLAAAARRLAGVEIVALHCNLGHQRALCTGIAHVLSLGRFDAIAVMDADGEDRPLDLPAMVDALASDPEAVVVAQRRKRHEGLPFRTFYRAYLGLFRVLTGKRLDFGNFSVMSAASADRLLHMAEAWNNYPATIMRSRLPIRALPVDRGRRYAGTSRMNFVALVNHGLGATSVFIDVVFTRLLVFFTLAFGVALAVSLAAVVVRLVTQVPLPGWLALGAAVAVLGLLLVLAVLVLSTFTLLSNRSMASDPPARRSLSYIRSVEPVGGGDA